MSCSAVLFKEPRAGGDPYAEAFSAAGWGVSFRPVLAFDLCNLDQLCARLARLSEAPVSGILCTR